MTCIPIPAPPGGTIGVTFSSGIRLMRSKNRPISGCSSSSFLFMFVNSALPGTNIGSTHCFSCCGFSQLYSRRPLSDISASCFSRYSRSLPVSLIMSSMVRGTRFFILMAISACSSVQIGASPIYSGDSFVIFSLPSTTGIRSVITLARRATGSLNGASGFGLVNFGNGSLINYPPFLLEHQPMQIRLLQRADAACQLFLYSRTS